MNKFIAVASFVVLASPALAQGMAAPSGGQSSTSMSSSDGMAGPSKMGVNDTMKMDHKKPAKKTAMKHDAMSGGMKSSDSMAAPTGGMASGSMSGPNH
jgi:hypothetical protein